MNTMEKRTGVVTITALLLIIGLFGCGGPSVEDILKKYESYNTTNMNSIGFSVSFDTENFINEGDVILKISDPTVKSDYEYNNAIMERVFVANAENPSEIFAVSPKTDTYTKISTQYAADGSTTNSSTTEGYTNYIPLDSIKARFIIIGFKGISAEESEKYESAPLFYIIDKKTKSVLTETPRLSGDLFAADTALTRFVERYATLAIGYSFMGGKEYVVKLGNVGNDSLNNGYTYIDILSNTVQSEDWIEYAYYYEDIESTFNVYMPLYTEIVVGKKHYQPFKYTTESGVGVRYSYKTTSFPDTIIVHSAEKNGGVYEYGYIQGYGYGTSARVSFQTTVKFDPKTGGIINKLSKE
jgi:hypothetical protein